jgi:uncharacterized protein
MQNEIAKMMQRVTQLLNSNLPDNYYYHNYEHTLYMVDKAMEIGVQEGCSVREIYLLAAGASWHDTGYIKTYKGHEEESVELCGLYLCAFGYAWEELEVVQGMIMATKMPQSPKTKLEEIIADADLEYLGTVDAAAKSDLLYRELQSINPLLTREEWNKEQISFLQQHSYFTQYCRENKEPLKQDYLNKLLNAAR